MIRKRLKSTFWKTHFWNFYFFQKSKFENRETIDGRILAAFISIPFSCKNISFFRKSLLHGENPKNHFFKNFQKSNFDKNRICQQNKENYRMEICSELLPQDMSSRFRFHSTFAHIINIIKKAFYISILYRIIFIRKQDYISRKSELL